MFEWKILEVKANDNGLITEARYFASVANKKFKVETEGNWFFREPNLKIPFEEVTEEMIVGWIKKETTQDGKNSVELRLDEQLQALADCRDVVAPWLPQIFTPKI